MPRKSVYCSREGHLNESDQQFLQKYRAFQDVLRKQKVSPLHAPTVAEHRQNIKHKAISIATQVELISELLRFHGWACMEKGRCTNQVDLRKIVLSYPSLYSYCQFLHKERGVKLWSLNKICQAIIGMLKFMKAKVEGIHTSTVDKMLEETRALYASISRSAKISLNERPSLCERRERGEALSFLDIVKVCEGQYWRYKALSIFSRRKNLAAILKSTVSVLIQREVKRLAVLFTLLKYPTRKVETQRSVIVKVAGSYRLKLSAVDRKGGRYPIDVKLNSMETQMFSHLRSLSGSSKEADSWHPFGGVKVTQVLKATTLDMVGVGITVTDLRSAAESHVDVIGYSCEKENENIQKALSYAEGHTEGMAKLFYKRNGSATVMKAWTAYVDKLTGFQEAKSDDDGSAIDQKIVQHISESQRRWVTAVQQQLWSVQSRLNSAKVPPAKRKPRAKWLAEEDQELRKQVRIYGEGNWKEIFQNSDMLQERYSGIPVNKARGALKDRWRNLMKASSSKSGYSPHTWSLAEDHALELAVEIYGCNWTEIWENTKMLREIYSHMPDNRAKEALRNRWRKLNADNKKVAVHSESGSSSEDSDEDDSSEEESEDDSPKVPVMYTPITQHSRKKRQKLSSSEEEESEDESEDSEEESHDDSPKVAVLCKPITKQKRKKRKAALCDSDPFDFQSSGEEDDYADSRPSVDCSTESCSDRALQSGAKKARKVIYDSSSDEEPNIMMTKAASTTRSSVMYRDASRKMMGHVNEFKASAKLEVEVVDLTLGSDEEE